jgi:hypothetical protein
MTTHPDSIRRSGGADGSAPAPAARPHRAVGAIGPRLAAVALVLGAALNTAEAVLKQLLPPRPADTAEQLQLVAEHATLFGVRAVLGTLAVPLMALAFLAMAQLLATRARKTAWIAGTALLLGMWGFVGVHFEGLVQLAVRGEDPQQAAAVLEAVGADPVFFALFIAPFLAGCVVGMVVLSVGLFVTRVVPRWVACVWLLFILLDFSIGAVGPVDPHWLWLAGAVGAAVHLLRARREPADAVGYAPSA